MGVVAYSVTDDALPAVIVLRVMAVLLGGMIVVAAYAAWEEKR